MVGVEEIHKPCPQGIGKVVDTHSGQQQEVLEEENQGTSQSLQSQGRVTPCRGSGQDGRKESMCRTRAKAQREPKHSCVPPWAERPHVVSLIPHHL